MVNVDVSVEELPGMVVGLKLPLAPVGKPLVTDKVAGLAWLLPLNFTVTM